MCGRPTRASSGACTTSKPPTSHGSARRQASARHAWKRSRPTYGMKAWAGIVAGTSRDAPACMGWWVNGRPRNTAPMRNHFGNIAVFTVREVSVHARRPTQHALVRRGRAMARRRTTSTSLIQELVDWMEDHKTGRRFIESASVGLGSPAVIITTFSSFALATDLGFSHAALALPAGSLCTARLCSGYVEMIAICEAREPRVLDRKRLGVAGRGSRAALESHEPRATSSLSPWSACSTGSSENMAEAPAHDYPTIEPASFDVVICGTGLPESVLAAACAAAGKNVLHVDPNPFYGSLYSSVETSGAAPEPSRRFTVDLVGPRVLYCADEAVDLLLRSGGSHHVEFKSVEGGSLFYWEGQLYPVPDSRQAIFNDATLELNDKTRTSRFFKLVKAHIAAASASGDEVGEGEACDKISEEDLDLPFIEYLKKHELSPKMRAVVLYAIAMADYDQDTDSCKKFLTTREGIQTIALYSSSIGRFANAEGAFINPMYGHGELPQAFCRCAAVQGALYVLRMPVSAVLMSEVSDSSEGQLETTSGNNEDLQPTVIWSCVYVQDIIEGTSSSLLSCPTPDENLDYRNILDSAKKLFTDICPNEKFLPRKSAPVYADDDSDSAE
ncbi:hypothetical protein PR202_gb26870 [Eleusine coracana subsp. coracana]|uniref:Rab proteins geranylgeranyltransferase component n=1 Tax=Eleusine coracana subsp. coracana TaxID=191504 RepID=A0AAV5FQ06_ELECO|nr:hypothetical protein PR202_gb26870 [Eleusine coracana subsp. coracana]